MFVKTNSAFHISGPVSPESDVAERGAWMRKSVASRRFLVERTCRNRINCSSVTSRNSKWDGCWRNGVFSNRIAERGSIRTSLIRTDLPTQRFGMTHRRPSTGRRFIKTLRPTSPLPPCESRKPAKFTSSISIGRMSRRDVPTTSSFSISLSRWLTPPSKNATTTTRF